MTPTAHRRLRLVLWLAAIGIGLGGLRSLDHGSLAGPDWSSPAAWARSRGLEDAVFAVLRLVTEALAWYLLVTTVAGAMARATSRPGALAGIERALDACTLPEVRRLLAATAGAGLAASVLVGAAAGAVTGEGRPAISQPGPVGPGGGGAAPDLPVMTRLPAGSSGEVPATPTTATPTTAAPTTAAPTTATQAAAPAGPSGEVAPATTAAPRAAARPVAIAPAAPFALTAWTARPGENLWLIASHHLRKDRGSSPTDAEIDRYVGKLVAHNLGRLADPRNPDLIYPGQVFELPASG